MRFCIISYVAIYTFDQFNVDSLHVLSYACDANKFGLVPNDIVPILSSMSYKDLVNIQCLSCNLVILTNKDTIDVVIRYAQLAEQNDYRIQIASYELIEEVLNG